MNFLGEKGAGGKGCEEEREKARWLEQKEQGSEWSVMKWQGVPQQSL